MVQSVLVSHLNLLAASVGADDDATIHDAVQALVVDLRTAVPSYCGLQLQIVDHDWPVTLTDFVGATAEGPATSLRIDLELLVEGADPASTIVFWANRPGTFVDLAADLEYSLGVHPTGESPRLVNHQRPTRQRIAWDLDLPPSSRRSGLTGIAELGTINRAVGFLIGQGEPPEDAHHTIRRGAASAGVDVPTFAARLLRR